MRNHSLMTALFPLFLVFISNFLQIKSLELTSTYDKGPILITPEVNLHYQVNKQDNQISFGLIFNDSTTFSTTGDVWVGIGIGEPTSGSMLGSDIVTAIFRRDELDNCLITDRYVPFTAYPLTEQPGPFPLPDDCDKPDWQLVQCKRDATSGLVIFEIKRPLVAIDKKQDRSILPGKSSFLYAYGNQFSYHGKRRYSTEITFYNENEDEDNSDDDKLPQDVNGSFDLLATNYTIPSRATTYACTSIKYPLPDNLDGERMIVAVEPVLFDATKAFVHHFTLYLCSGDAYFNSTVQTTACDGDEPPYGPLGNGAAQCSTFVYGYAKGVGRVSYPENVGILLEKKRPYLVMETHFDNPDNAVGKIDMSGVRIHYTNTKRKHAAGSILLGDSFVSRFPLKVQSNYLYQHSCPSVCTKRLSEPINLFSSFLHMHTTGREIYTNIFSENNTFIRNYNKVNFWSDSFQKGAVFKDPIKLRPGDQLQTSCIYDTSKRPDTEWGVATKDEMCMDFVLYWPLQVDPITTHEFNSCYFWALRQEDGQIRNITYCGDNGRFGDFFDPSLFDKFPSSENPAFNDTVGAPTEFGQSGGICPTTSPSPSTPLKSSSASPTNTPQPSSSNMEETPEPEDSLSPQPSTSSDPSSAASPTPEPSSVCFPSSATVTLRNGIVKRMDQIKIGDEVMVGKAKYSTVFMFTHFNQHIKNYQFIQVSTKRYNLRLSLTAGHYIYADSDKRLIQARKLKLGDIIHTIHGEDVISDIKYVHDDGLYNPQTLHGDIIVDNVLTSTFTETIQSNTATALLAPLRWMYHLLSIDFSPMFS